MDGRQRGRHGEECRVAKRVSVGQESCVSLRCDHEGLYGIRKRGQEDDEHVQEHSTESEQLQKQHRGDKPGYTPLQLREAQKQRGKYDLQRGPGRKQRSER